MLLYVIPRLKRESLVNVFGDRLLWLTGMSKPVKGVTDILKAEILS